MRIVSHAEVFVLHALASRKAFMDLRNDLLLKIID